MSTKATAVAVATTPTTPASALDSAKAPSEQEIGLRAYELYLERGAQDGHALDDWLQAERELKAKKGN